MKEGLLNTKDFKEEDIVSKLDMDLRVKLFKSKQTALKKNPNLFISETRLCFRNLPKSFTDQDLKTILEHYLEEWKHTLSHEYRS